MPPPPPSPEQLRAFCAGALPAAAAAAVDAWLADLDPRAAEAALTAAGALAEPAPLAVAEPPAGFAADLPRSRLEPGEALGEGGMAVVRAARDRLLERVVALKSLRPRRADEALADFHLREAAFRREAALTAALEHPAIPPVYDVGSCDGLPAFAMRRLQGRTLAAALAAGDPPLAPRIEALLRVAEALAFAHSRGVVHRDLTPANILLAGFGAVYVLDWGLAARRGEDGGARSGTPGWMAPEQAAGAPADPRMDVWALGGLLLAGGEPLPAPLAALARRCREPDPARRYPDAGAVAEELRRWLAEGLTLAQEARPWELAWLRLRRSRRLRAAALAAAAMLAAGLGAAWAMQRAERAEALARIAHLAGTGLERPEAVAVALDEARALAARHPGLAAAAALVARLQAAHDLARRQAGVAAVRDRLDGLLHRTRTLGPWADQVQDWRAAIAQARALEDPALAEPMAAALAFRWRAEREQGGTAAAGEAAAALAAEGPTPAWRALGRLLGRTAFAAHDPVFCACADADATLAEAATTAVALALYAPEPRLAAAARAALALRPGDFWPLIAAGRASLAEGDAAAAERLGLVASGAEPGSLLPPLLLAYAALEHGDAQAIAAWTARGLGIDAGNSELLALAAAGLARTGHLDRAQAVVDGLDPGHLRYHLDHRVGHPMERSVAALAAAGVRIPAAPAALGPLVPGHRHPPP